MKAHCRDGADLVVSYVAKAPSCRIRIRLRLIESFGIWQCPGSSREGTAIARQAPDRNCPAVV